LRWIPAFAGMTGKGDFPGSGPNSTVPGWDRGDLSAAQRRS